MGNIIEFATWEDNISLIEIGESPTGGTDGVANRAIKQLANRTKYLNAKHRGGYLGVESIVDITLSKTSEGFQAIKMNQTGKDVIFPDATGLIIGGPLFIIKNIGSFTFNIKNNEGEIILADVGINQTFEFYLTSNNTKNGTWLFYGMGDSSVSIVGDSETETPINYYTVSELSSSTAASGASKIGIDSTNILFSDKSNLQEVLEDISSTSSGSLTGEYYSKEELNKHDTIDSGASKIGVYTNLQSSNKNNIQGVLQDFDEILSASGGTSSSTSLMSWMDDRYLRIKHFSASNTDYNDWRDTGNIGYTFYSRGDDQGAYIVGIPDITYHNINTQSWNVAGALIDLDNAISAVSGGDALLNYVSRTEMSQQARQIIRIDASNFNNFGQGTSLTLQDAFRIVDSNFDGLGGSSGNSIIYNFYDANLPYDKTEVTDVQPICYGVNTYNDTNGGTGINYQFRGIGSASDYLTVNIFNNTNTSQDYTIGIGLLASPSSEPGSLVVWNSSGGINGITASSTTPEYDTVGVGDFELSETASNDLKFKYNTSSYFASFGKNGNLTINTSENNAIFTNSNISSGESISIVSATANFPTLTLQDSTSSVSIYYEEDGGADCLKTDAAWIGSKNLYPLVTSTFDVGTSAYRYNDIYCVSLNESSDERLKDNIVPLGNDSLDIINKIIPISYKWKNFYNDRQSKIVTQNKTVTKAREVTKEIIEFIDGKYVKKYITEIEEYEENVVNSHILYDENGNEIGTHDIIETEQVEKIYVEGEEQTFHRKHFGISAQQLKIVLDELNIDTEDFAPYVYDNENDKYSIRYIEFVPHLMKCIQLLTERIEILESV